MTKKRQPVEAQRAEAFEPKCPFCNGAMRALPVRGPYLRTWKCDPCKVGVSKEYGDWMGQQSPP